MTPPPPQGTRVHWCNFGDLQGNSDVRARLGLSLSSSKFSMFPRQPLRVALTSLFSCLSVRVAGVTDSQRETRVFFPKSPLVLERKWILTNRYPEQDSQTLIMH